MTRLRIVNLNTWIGVLVKSVLKVTSIEPPGHKRQRFDALVAELRERAPDVVTLQECTPLPGFAQSLADALGYDLYWRVGNSGLRLFQVGLPWGIGRGEGLATLARKDLRLRHVANRRLSGKGLVKNWVAVQTGPVRVATACRVSVGERPVVVVNTHVRYGFPNPDAFWEGWRTLRERGVVAQDEPPSWLLKLLHDNRTQRDLELERLATWALELQRAEGAPLVLGVDFNLDPDAPQVARFLDETGYTNVLPRFAPGALTWDPATNYNVGLGTSYTWADGSPKSMILQLMAYLDRIPQTPDHVVCSPGLTPVAGGVAFAEPRGGILASDHYGVWADLELDVALPALPAPPTGATHRPGAASPP